MTEGALAPPGTEPAPETAAAGVVADEAKAKAEPTEYHILELIESSGAVETYKVIARNVKAQGGQNAIKSTVTPTEEKKSYLAVPSRSMKLYAVSLKVKQQTVIE